MREAGFAIKLLDPSPAGAEIVPPGQGQLLVVLRGSAELTEHGGDAGKVVMTERPTTSHQLDHGALYRVANDAAWSLRALAPQTRLLVISTSVPRTTRRSTQVLDQARGRLHMSPRLLFTNEMLRLEFSAARGRLPGRGWVPWYHQAEGTEYALILAGRFAARLKAKSGPDGSAAWAGDLDEGSLLTVPPGVAHRFRAAGAGLNVGLILSPLMRRREGGTVDRNVVRGFTPFARR